MGRRALSITASHVLLPFVDMSERCACRTQSEKDAVCAFMSESLSCASELNHFKRWTLSSTSLPVPESVRWSSAATDSLPAGRWYKDPGPALWASPAPVCSIQPSSLSYAAILYSEASSDTRWDTWHTYILHIHTCIHTYRYSWDSWVWAVIVLSDKNSKA